MESNIFFGRVKIVVHSGVKRSMNLVRDQSCISSLVPYQYVNELIQQNTLGLHTV